MAPGDKLLATTAFRWNPFPEGNIQTPATLVAPVASSSAASPSLQPTPGLPSQPGRDLGSWKAWQAILKMGRPLILLSGVLAYALGAAMGFGLLGAFDGRAGLAAFVVTMLANLMAHYADEYADIDVDSVARPTIFSGGSGVLPSGTIPPIVALCLARGLLALSLLAALVFWLLGWLPPVCLLIAGLGLAGGWMYSMPPAALERRGFGELTNAILGAFLMPLMGFCAQTGTLEQHAVLFLLPVFTLVMVNLLGVHWADRAANAACGRRTLPVILGDRTRWLHGALVFASYALLPLLRYWGMPSPVAFGILLSLPIATWAALTFAQGDSPVPSSMAMVVGMLGALAGWLVVGAHTP